MRWAAASAFEGFARLDDRFQCSRSDRPRFRIGDKISPSLASVPSSKLGETTGRDLAIRDERGFLERVVWHSWEPCTSFGTRLSWHSNRTLETPASRCKMPPGRPNRTLHLVSLQSHLDECAPVALVAHDNAD